MSVEWIEHTADIGMRVRADTLPGLFAEAFTGLLGLLGPEYADSAREPIRRELNLTASDKTALLVDFLNSVLSLAHAKKEGYELVHLALPGDAGLVAVIEGRPVLGFSEDVKAVTFHEAAIAPTLVGGWETTIIFDL